MPALPRANEADKARCSIEIRKQALGSQNSSVLPERTGLSSDRRYALGSATDGFITQQPGAENAMRLESRCAELLCEEVNMWVKTENELPPRQNVKKERRRYMAYSPDFGGYAFRCWYNDGFGCDSVRSMIGGVTHYRPARRGEKDHQLTAEELSEIKDA